MTEPVNNTGGNAMNAAEPFQRPEVSIEDASPDELDRIYRYFNEEQRLKRSQAHSVEFLTTVRCLGQYVKPGMKVLDVGAGAGCYSFWLADQGCEVTALEPAAPNLEALIRNIGDRSVTALSGDARDLSAFPDASRDIILLLGPFYHIPDFDGRRQALAEALRVLKPGGMLFCAFIGNDLIHLTELMFRPDFFSSDSYDRETFKIHDRPFVFHTLDQMRELLDVPGLRIVREIASDGLSELLEDQVNSLSEDDFAQYLRYHYYTSEKPEMLGRSSHLLFAARKRED